MSRHNKYDLLEQINQAISESGWNVIYLDSADEHPFRVQIYNEIESYQLKIYIWHLTHGGGAARPRHEYRIQITGVNRFDVDQGEKTLILGWWEEVGVFAGFDVRKHLGLLGLSPSIQIREQALHQAYLNGFAPCDKGNKEIAIAFRPDFFVEYVQNLEALHDFGQSAADLAVLAEVAQKPEINTENLPIQDEARKVVVVSVSKKLRGVNFRKRVLTVYRYSCALCGVQLNLVEAAHIVPVNYETSTDETCNGLALCSLHHKAFDQALVTLTDDYSILINPKQVAELTRRKLVDGLDAFQYALRPLILLPPAVSDRPHLAYIRLANKIRGWV